MLAKELGEYSCVPGEEEHAPKQYEDVNGRDILEDETVERCQIGCYAKVKGEVGIEE